MELPSFLAFEVTDQEQGYPFAVAWSLKNGQYKSVLIKPEDDWLIDWENGQDSIGAPALQDLMVRGEGVLDILKEWEEDFYGGEVYCEDPALAQYCLDLMYDAYSKDAAVEVIPVSEAFAAFDANDIDDQRRWIMDTEGLNAVSAEDVTLTFIHLYAQVHGISQDLTDQS